MKKLFTIWLLFLVSASPGLCQEVTTNWVHAAPQFKMFGTNIYDTSKWPNTPVPAMNYEVSDYSGRPGGPATIIGHRGEDYSYSISFAHFPYNPADFRKTRADATYIVPARQMYCKALLVTNRVQWTQDGMRIVRTSLEYDCGLPIAELFPIMVTNSVKSTPDLATNIATNVATKSEH